MDAPLGVKPLQGQGRFLAVHVSRLLQQGFGTAQQRHKKAHGQGKGRHVAFRFAGGHHPRPVRLYILRGGNAVHGNDAIVRRRFQGKAQTATIQARIHFQIGHVEGAHLPHMVPQGANGFGIIAPAHDLQGSQGENLHQGMIHRREKMDGKLAMQGRSLQNLAGKGDAENQRTTRHATGPGRRQRTRGVNAAPPQLTRPASVLMNACDQGFEKSGALGAGFRIEWLRKQRRQHDFSCKQQRPDISITARASPHATRASGPADRPHPIPVECTHCAERRQEDRRQKNATCLPAVIPCIERIAKRPPGRGAASETCSSAV